MSKIPVVRQVNDYQVSLFVLKRCKFFAWVSPVRERYATLCTALRTLGYATYHGTEVFKNTHDMHLKCWEEGLTAKYYNGKPYGRSEFDKLLKNYNVNICRLPEREAVTDPQCALFPDELIAAYPEAKVVLTTRNPDSWIRSMETVYYSILRWYTWNPVLIYDPNNWGALHKLVLIILVHLTSGEPYNRAALRRGFIAHNEHVRSIVPQHNLLDYEVSEGWEPLCKFLGKSGPDGPFPCVNEGSQMVDRMKVLLFIKALQGFTVPAIVAL
ncbi:MAG: hypothetical protein MMC33_010734, partial [Icmadophila ericetorum]|nr:hypothetical protein [Icmadophila ericetorum]